MMRELARMVGRRPGWGRLGSGILSAVLLGGLVAGCAGSPDRSTSATYKVGQPYTINGVRYIPQEDASYREDGIASWYGKDFHGKRTANGEVYDMRAMTAAHTTLPLPSHVRVTNLENGRQAILRVNDRGPFARGRILDVSREAARVLGFEMQGTAKVRVEYVGVAPLDQRFAKKQRKPLPVAQDIAPTMVASKTPAKATVVPPAGNPVQAAAPVLPARRLVTASILPVPVARMPAADPARGEETQSLGTLHLSELAAASSETGVFVQTGVFSNPDNADRMRLALTSLGPVTVKAESVNATSLYKVRIGPFSSRDDAGALLGPLAALGVSDAIVIVE